MLSELVVESSVGTPVGNEAKEGAEVLPGIDEEWHADGSTTEEQEQTSLRGGDVTLLEEPREVTSDWYVQQATRLLDFDGGRELDSVLVYAAVELRAAIERTLFELLVFVKELQLTDEELKTARSRDGVDALLTEADSHYRKTCEFTQLVAEVVPGLPRIAPVDTAYLRRRWHDLSEFCHSHRQPEKSFASPGRKFQRDGFQIVHDVLGHFQHAQRSGFAGLLLRSTMPDETRRIYDQFVAGEKDAGQTRWMLMLSEPVLRQRLALRL